MRYCAFGSRQKGFSLLETLVYIGVASIILGAAAAFYDALNRLRQQNLAMVEVEQQGARAMRAIVRLARNADAITSPTAGTSAASATLLSPIAADSPTVFSVISGALYVTSGAQAPAALTSASVRVTEFSASNLTPAVSQGLLRFKLTLEFANASNRPGSNHSATFYGSASLR